MPCWSPCWSHPSRSCLAHWCSTKPSNCVTSGDWASSRWGSQPSTGAYSRGLRGRPLREQLSGSCAGPVEIANVAPYFLALGVVEDGGRHHLNVERIGQ